MAVTWRVISTEIIYIFMQSAKTNLNVEEVFFSIARDIKQRLTESDSKAEVMFKRNSPRVIYLIIWVLNIMFLLFLDCSLQHLKSTSQIKPLGLVQLRQDQLAVDHENTDVQCLKEIKLVYMERKGHNSSDSVLVLKIFLISFFQAYCSVWKAAFFLLSWRKKENTSCDMPSLSLKTLLFSLSWCTVMGRAQT